MWSKGTNSYLIEGFLFFASAHSVLWTRCMWVNASCETSLRKGWWEYVNKYSGYHLAWNTSDRHSKLTPSISRLMTSQLPKVITCFFFLFPFFNFFFLIKEVFIYSIMLISAAQKSDCFTLYIYNQCPEIKLIVFSIMVYLRILKIAPCTMQ